MNERVERFVDSAENERPSAARSNAIIAHVPGAQEPVGMLSALFGLAVPTLGATWTDGRFVLPADFYPVV